jgi:hypothetical protein
MGSKEPVKSLDQFESDQVCDFSLKQSEISLI